MSPVLHEPTAPTSQTTPSYKQRLWEYICSGPHKCGPSTNDVAHGYTCIFQDEAIIIWHHCLLHFYLLHCTPKASLKEEDGVHIMLRVPGRFWVSFLLTWIVVAKIQARNDLLIILWNPNTLVKPNHAEQHKLSQLSLWFCAKWNEASGGLDSSIFCFQFQRVQLVNQTFKAV